MEHADEDDLVPSFPNIKAVESVNGNEVNET